MQQKKLDTSENPAPFLEQVKKLNDCACLSIQALAFTVLFQFYDGDI